MNKHSNRLNGLAFQSVSASQSSRRAAFTLVELLAVMALISLLMWFSVSGVRVLTSRTLARAGNQVGFLFDFARQHAMSSNLPTALVLCTGAGTDDDGRTFTVLDYSTHTGWKQIRPWESLPEGTCVGLGGDASVNTFVAKSDLDIGLPDGEVSSVAIRGLNLTADQYAFRVFLPNGSVLSEPGISACLQLLEGEVVNGASKPRRVPTVYYQISLITATGRSKVDYTAE